MYTEEGAKKVEAVASSASLKLCLSSEGFGIRPSWLLCRNLNCANKDHCNAAVVWVCGAVLVSAEDLQVSAGL